MVYTLIDDWLYMDVEGKQGVYGRKEVELNFKSKIKGVTAAFLDYQTKTVPILSQKNNLKEGSFESSFDREYLTVQEKVSNHSIQIIGVKEEKIKEIYGYFRGLRLESLVPYGVAIRAFLKSKDILNSHPHIIFLDDLGNQAVMTIFERMCFSSPRRVSIRDTGYMISEIKRSWQGFISNQKEGVIETFTLVSNNQEWLRAFVDEGVCGKENIIHVDVNFAVLEGLKSAKFAIHFVLAEEILRNKRFKKWQDRLKFSLLCSIFILFSSSFYMGGMILVKKRLSYYQVLDQQKNRYQQQLRSLYHNKFISFLRSKEILDYAKVYHDFIKSIPEGFFFDDFRFEKTISQEVWNIQVLIYPGNEYVRQKEFQYHNSFFDAKVSPIIINKLLGQQISLSIHLNNGDL